MLKIRIAKKEDYVFIFKSITLLLDKKLFSMEQFKSYYFGLIESEINTEIWIYSECEVDKGYIVANKFAIPRYLGYGIELEEIVILPEFQNMGIGKKFIELLIDYYKSNKVCRKIIIKTDDHQGAGKLYNRLLDVTEMKIYHRFINKL